VQVSKWRGDSEKLIRVLFELARYHAPSTIFLDELDSIMSHRGGSETGSGDEHEGSRRMKTELLIQMDGLARTDDLVFVLGASNIPWDLDIAVRRRLEKRILVPLPNRVARKMILELHLKDRCVSHDADFSALSDRTGGYSGADLVLVCKEALMRPVRRAMIELEKADALGKPIPSGQITLGEVSMEDIEGALAATRPSSKETARYVKWQTEFGSVM
jgi:katanin p60 ATPase-containing subunit A1